MISIPFPRPFFRAMSIALVLMAVTCDARSATYGQIERKLLADTGKECRERQLGPYEPEPKKTGIRNSSCDILFLKPYDPLATPEGQFAHSIELPDEDKRKEVYRQGMTDKEYFGALCKAEAGEIVRKNIENVRGIAQLRPTQQRQYRFPLFAEELQVGNVSKPQDLLVQPYLGNYHFLEMRLAPREKERLEPPYVRYYRDPNANPGRWFLTTKNGRDLRIPYIVAHTAVNALTARYGYTSRGIRRPSDFEHGIKGGEFIIVDRQTAEVLAYQRVFVRYYFKSDRPLRRDLMEQELCPVNLSTLSQFIQRVLRPANID